MRCLALADALRDVGWSCTFFSTAATAVMVPALAESGHECLTMEEGTSNESEQLARHWPGGVTALIVDHYASGYRFERACRKLATHIVVLDDQPNRPHDCDVLLDQNMPAHDVRYQPLVPAECELLLGPRFALLRAEFQVLHTWSREISEVAENILVTFGMSDPDNATANILELLYETAKTGARINVVVGAPNKNYLALKARVDVIGAPVSLYRSPALLSELMMESDIAIAAAGSTCWELAFMGLPSVAVIMSPDQKQVAETLSRSGAARVCDWSNGRAGGQILQMLGALASDRETRERMSAAGRALVDGHGASRVASHISSRC